MASFAGYSASFNVVRNIHIAKLEDSMHFTVSRYIKIFNKINMY